MSTIIESIEQRQLRQIPRFSAGDRVRVHFQVVEGTRKRTQVFEGIVIARQGSGARETFIVRKQSFGVGVERTFPVHSPKIEQLEVVARGAVRRAKLYYLRGRVGKRARVAERRWGIEDDLVMAPAEEPVAVDSEGVAQEELDPAAAEEGGDEEATEAAAEDAPEPQAEADEEAPDAPDDAADAPEDAPDASAEDAPDAPDDAPDAPAEDPPDASADEASSESGGEAADSEESS